MKPTFASEPISALSVELNTASLIRPVHAAVTMPATSHSPNTTATMTALSAVRPKYWTASDRISTAADTLPHASVTH